LQKAKEAVGKRLEKLEAKEVRHGEKLAELETRIDGVVAHLETMVLPAPPAPPGRRLSMDMERHRATANQELKDLRAELELEKLTREHSWNLQSIEDKNRSDTAIQAAIAEATLTKKDRDHADTQSAQMKEQLAVLNAKAAAAAAGPSKGSNDKKKKKKHDTKGKRQETSSDSSLGDSTSDSDSSSSGEDTPPGSPSSKKRSKAGGSWKKGKKEKKNKRTRKKLKKQAYKSEENSSGPE
jgi:hypothetical protein